jgi:peptide-methionine (R)-S-oxide reductase
MWRHRLLLWAWASSATLLGLAVSIAAAAAQDPFEVPEKPAPESKGKTEEKTSEKKGAPEFVRKTDEEWAKILHPAVYMVTRQKVTEPAFSGKYATGHYRGTFLCACCDAAGVEQPLFSAQTKFDSGTGWPSFWRPVSTRAIKNAIDNSEAEQRIEVMCSRCDAHLGHVFNDNPAAPTGLRYCINSLSLKLKPLAGASSAKPASTNIKTKAKVRTRTRNGLQTSRSKGKATTPDSDSQDQGDAHPGGTKPSSSGN